MSGMLDTNIVIDFARYEDELPNTDLGISAVVFAELSAGVMVLKPGLEREKRRARLEWAQTFFQPYAFDHDVATVYARLVALLRRTGRSERSRIADVMIAATAAAWEMPLYTANVDDFVGLDALVDVVGV